MKGFWLLNDNEERAVEAVGKRVAPRRPDAGGLARATRRRRRLGAILVAVAFVLVASFELLPFVWPIISLITPLLATIVAALSAYALTRLRWRGANLFSRGVLVAYLMPGIVMLIPIMQLFSALRLTNSLGGLALAYPTFALPFAIWLMMGYYSTIPEELETAALIDGCNRLQAFYKVILPPTKPALLAVGMYVVTLAWSEFLFAYVMIHSEGRMTIPVGLAQMVVGDVLPWGELSAAAVLISIPVLLLFILGQRFMVAGLTTGAVKGG